MIRVARRWQSLAAPQPEQSTRPHAVLSVFDMFSIGIGPSSSHTVGPMRAARQFALALEEAGLLARVQRVRTDLYGSLALTGEGHGTPKAILLGLEGDEPQQVSIEGLEARVEGFKAEAASLTLLAKHQLPFQWERDLHLRKEECLPGHSNGMRFMAFDGKGDLLLSRVFYSIGGGFIVEEGEGMAAAQPASRAEPRFAFASAAELLQLCRERGLSIAELCLQNELMWRQPTEIEEQTMAIWRVMDESIVRGCKSQQLHLPGDLRLRRRAPALLQKLIADHGYAPRGIPVGAQPRKASMQPMAPLEYLSLFAMAVNEENAGGGRVVTAPTNGAAGSKNWLLDACSHSRGTQVCFGVS